MIENTLRDSQTASTSAASTNYDDELRAFDAALAAAHEMYRLQIARQNEHRRALQGDQLGGTRSPEENVTAIRTADGTTVVIASPKIDVRRGDASTRASQPSDVAAVYSINRDLGDAAPAQPRSMPFGWSTQRSVAPVSDAGAADTTSTDAVVPQINRLDQNGQRLDQLSTLLRQLLELELTDEVAGGLQNLLTQLDRMRMQRAEARLANQLEQLGEELQIIEAFEELAPLLAA